MLHKLTKLLKKLLPQAENTYLGYSPIGIYVVKCTACNRKLEMKSTESRILKTKSTCCHARILIYGIKSPF